MPAPGYLEFLRDQSTKRGIVLIYDEIVTGFRIAPGGAQEFFGIDCDIAVYSKAIGGGLPISAFAGKRPIMELVAANKVKHGGTYNGNPICAAAALYTLRSLAQPDTQERIKNTGNTLMEAIRRSAADNRVPCVVQGEGSMFQVLFNRDGKAPLHYRDVMNADMTRYGVLRQSLLEQGVHINTSGLACWFVSAAHDGTDIELTIAAIERAMKLIA
jgi:glutamate-1-semialdehyde 2,1-aminomutase